jgi:hypothetical protein
MAHPLGLPTHPAAGASPSAAQAQANSPLHTYPVIDPSDGTHVLLHPHQSNLSATPVGTQIVTSEVMEAHLQVQGNTILPYLKSAGAPGGDSKMQVQ